MSCKVIVISEGYSKDATATSMRANCSCVLVKDGAVNVVVDTMTAWDSQTILEGLKKETVLPADVQFVVNTHGHSDHCGNNNLFLAAKHVTGNSLSKGDVYEFHDFKASHYSISRNIEVLRTPGHTAECVSVKVTNTSLRTVIITGDLFEKEEDIEDASIWISAGTHNEKLQRDTRHLIIQQADYIVPGHGPMFKVTAEQKIELERQSRLFNYSNTEAIKP